MFVRRFVFLTSILFFNALRNSSAQDKNVLSIGILFEFEQQNILREISDVFKELESSEKQTIDAQFILINRQNLKESMEMLCKSLYSGTSIILDLSYYPWEEAIDIINSAGIPYLKIDISLIPFLRVVETYLLARGNATDAVLIFQNEKDLSEALYYAVRGTQFRVFFVNAMNETFTQKLKKLRPIPSYYVVFATTNSMDAIFSKIIGANLLTRPDKWHLCFFDFNSEEFLYIQNVTNTTKIALDPKTSCFSKNSYGLCEPPTTFFGPKIVLTEVLTAILQTSKIPNFVQKKWDCKSDLNETNYEDQDTSSEIIKILEGSDVLKIIDEEVTLKLNMTMQIYTGRSQKYSETALWSQEQLQPLQGEIKSARRFLRIGTAEALPWSYISRDSLTGKPIFDESGKPVWEGYCIDLINKMAVKMNFDYELVIPKKGSFGKRLPDGSWDGLIGDLITGETDIAVAALKMTSDREEVIDFVAPYFEQTGISIVIRKPVRQTSLFKFMTVLRFEVWLSIVAALVATAVLLWLLDKYSPYSARNNKKAYPYPCRDFTLKESFWFALTSFTPQGGGEPPKAISGRTLVAAYWLFVVLMLATFTANLAAFLTVERMQTPVQSLEQLARQSRINYTVVEGSDTHKYFINMKYAEDTLYRMWKELTLNATSDTEKYRIWDYPIKEQYAHILLAINSSNPVKDASEGFRIVNEHENADFAFIHDSAEIKYEITKNCNLTEVGEVFAEQPYAIAVQQGSNLQDELSYAILEFQKDRYFEELTAKFWNNSLNKECSGSEDNEGITLESLGGVFIATLFGLALAMITLAGEVIYYRRKDRTLKKVTPSQKEVEDWTIFHPSKDSLKEKLDELKMKPLGAITLGEQFIPVRQARNRVSYIAVQPRNPIHETIGYYE